MAQPNARRETTLPARGVPGGWIDPWDAPIDYAALRTEAEAAERCLEQRTAALAPAWQAEQARERKARERDWSRAT